MPLRQDADGASDERPTTRQTRRVTGVRKLLGRIIYRVAIVWGGAPVTVERAEILQRIASMRIVLLVAPGGSGKTTTAEQILTRWELGTVRVRFTTPSGLDAAIGALVRGVRRAGLADIAESMTRALADDPVGALDAFVGLANESQLACAVLLDDVQHLDAVAARELGGALCDLGPMVRVVVSGRTLDAFADLATLARSAVIDAEALRLSNAEIEAALGGASPTLVEDVAAATTGWCAAVGLVGQRLRSDPTWSPSAPGSARALLDDLVGEVLEQSPDLVALGAAPLLDREVASIVGGADLFEAAQRAGIVAPHRGRWWVIPDPIRESLRFDFTLDLVRRTAIARHYRDCGDLYAAVELCASGSPRELVDFLAALHWNELEALGIPDLLAWIDGLDRSAFAIAPELLVSVAQAVELAAPDRRREFLDAALELSDGRPTVARAARVEIARVLYGSAHLDAAAEIAQAVLDELTDEEHSTRGRALLTLAGVSVYQCTPASLAKGADLYAEGARAFRVAGETRWLAESLARRGYTALYMAGSPREGEAEMRAALALLPTGDFSRGFWLANYSDVLDYLGRVPEAEAAANEALDIGIRRRDRTVEGMGWWSHTWIAAHRCDVAAFRAALTALERTMGQWVRPGQQVEVYASTAEHLAMLGDHAGYADFVARARACEAALDYPTPIELAEARHLALYGDPDAAVAMLERLDSGTALVPSNRPTRVILFALAEARRHNLELARSLWADAQASAEAMGVPDLLFRYAKPVVAMIEELLDETSRDGTVEASVTLRVLGGFSVERAGGQCTPQPGHPAMLVKLLALNALMTVDAAIDAMWPDADGDTGRARLRNLLNRLKQRSGELVIRDGETLRLHPSVSCDLDVFERRCASALSAAADERVGLARGALALYTGELLPGDIYDDWTIGRRERTKRRYLALADVVAEDAITRGDTDEAVRLLDLAIGAEPLDESRYARMCEVLVAQGRVGTAREVAARAIAALDDVGEVADPRLYALARG